MFLKPDYYDIVVMVRDYIDLWPLSLYIIRIWHTRTHTHGHTRHARGWKGVLFETFSHNLFWTGISRIFEIWLSRIVP